MHSIHYLHSNPHLKKSKMDNLKHPFSPMVQIFKTASEKRSFLEIAFLFDVVAYTLVKSNLLYSKVAMKTFQIVPFGIKNSSNASLRTDASWLFYIYIMSSFGQK